MSKTPQGSPGTVASFTDKDRPPRATNDVEMAWASDVMAEMLRRLDVRYISLLPGASYRGLHDSLVNYLGNQAPKMLVCLHEEHAVALAHGYAKVTERPMAVALHSNVGLMHGTMAIFDLFCSRMPALILGATGPVDAEQRRPWIDWIHTSKDQGAIIRPYTKWDDEPRSVGACIESMMRAWQIAATEPRGPTYVCLDVALQEERLQGKVTFPDVARFAPADPPAPSPDAVEQAAKLLAQAQKPVILMGRMSRRDDDWQARIDLAESLGAAVLTDLKVALPFPTDHPLHVVEPRFRPSPEVTEIFKQADVILSLDWVDLKGQFEMTFGKGKPVTAKIINCSLDQYLHNGWDMGYFGLPEADLSILASPDKLTRPLTAAIRKLRGGNAAPSAKFQKRPTKPLGDARPGRMVLRDVATTVARFRAGRAVSLTNASLGWPGDTVRVAHPLDYLGYEGGAGVGSGPGSAVGSALALMGSGRIPLAVIGDGDFMMGNQALWTAAHMGIPMILLIANNQVYMNDVAHQERIALTRSRPVENKYVGQEMTDPPIDIEAIARAQGWEATMVETASDLAKALEKGESLWKEGRPFFIDARIDPRAEEARDNTAGRKEG